MFCAIHSPAFHAPRTSLAVARMTHVWTNALAFWLHLIECLSTPPPPSHRAPERACSAPRLNRADVIDVGTPGTNCEPAGPLQGNCLFNHVGHIGTQFREPLASMLHGEADGVSIATTAWVRRTYRPRQGSRLCLCVCVCVCVWVPVSVSVCVCGGGMCVF